MISATAISRYKTVQMNTSSPGELLLLLQDGLFRFLTEAGAALRRGDRAVAGERIGRSHDILSELVTSLKPSVAPELCANLEGIYLFCMGRIVEANLHQDAARIDDVLRILAPLREAWILAVRGEPLKQAVGAR